MRKFDRTLYDRQAQIFKALAHPIRLFIVDELSRSERCVCELTEMVGVKMPTISRHLSILRSVGIIEEEKRGVQIYYKLVTPCVVNFFKCVAEVRRKSIQRETKILNLRKAAAEKVHA